jgi:hypothetical protein
MDQQQAEEIWQQLRAAIKQIHNHNASSLSFEELYRYFFATTAILTSFLSIKLLSCAFG